MTPPDRAPPHSLLDGAALFLDFDGTLVELAEVPDAIEVPGGLHPLLERLGERLEGRLAIVSGRSIDDLRRYVRFPGITLSGSHGLELHFAGGIHHPPEPPPGLREARAAIAGLAARGEGLIVEEKPASVALHFRLAPHREGEVAAFMAELAERTGLTLQPGKMVAELRPHGRDKGDALAAILAEPPFAGARPLFMGDDLTDEAAFRAAAELGGAGILVGPPRDTAALWRLPDVAAVAHWLSEAAHG